jgi:uncharacterized protein
VSTVSIHRTDDLLAFAHRVMPYLMQREAQHNIMLGLFAVLQARPPELPPYLAWAERDGELVGAAMRTPPYRVLLAHGSESGAIEAFARDLSDKYVTLPGVLGGKAEAAAFTESWTALSGQAVNGGRHERLYRLDQVIPARSVPGALREPAASDLDLLVDWWTAFSEEAIGPITREQAAFGVSTRYGVDPLVAGLRLWEADGQPVSLVGYTGPTPNSIRVGPVYTPPEQRGRGYASAATAALCQHLLDQGFRFVTLYTDLANPTSNKIYQAVGYVPVCDVDELFFAPA